MFIRLYTMFGLSLQYVKCCLGVLHVVYSLERTQSSCVCICKSTSVLAVQVCKLAFKKQ